MLLSILFENPLVFILVCVALLLSLSVHECAHAYVAHKLGDDTAKYLGRVTLNPKAHLDPLGTIFLLIAGFGWGKPVPVNPYNFKSPKRDQALVSFAGPASNFLLAFGFAILYHVFAGTPAVIATLFLYFVVLFNLLLGVFNLIPIHPLDGFKIVNGFLPEHLSHQWLQTAPYGIYILLLLSFTRSLTIVTEPILNFFMRLLGIAG